MATANYDHDNILVAIETGDNFDACDFELLICEVRESLKGGYDAERYDHRGTVIWYDTVYTDSGYQFATVSVVVRSGYYSGLNLDYVIEEGGDIDVIQARGLGIKGVTKKLDKLVKRVEGVLRQHGTELKVMGRFSNGEAIYEKA